MLDKTFKKKMTDSFLFNKILKIIVEAEAGFLWLCQLFEGSCSYIQLSLNIAYMTASGGRTGTGAGGEVHSGKPTIREIKNLIFITQRKLE